MDLAHGYPDTVKHQVMEMLCGQPWQQLVTLGHIVDITGEGFFSITSDGYKAAVECWQTALGYPDTPIETQSVDKLRNMPPKRPASHQNLLVFISHSSKNADLALALIDLLKDGLGLLASQIRCSSVDGYRLPVGVNTEDKLREEVNAAKVVVGLITPSSLVSYYVMFELGARWGADLFLAPLLAGVRPNELSGPLSLLNALDATSDGQLHQLLADVSKQLSFAAPKCRFLCATCGCCEGVGRKTL